MVVGLAACTFGPPDTGAAVPASTVSPGVAFTPAPGDGSAGRSLNAANGFGDVTYHSGPVISNVRVTVIYWNSTVAFQSTWPSFYTSITNSTYMDWLNEYRTSTQGIGRGSFVNAVVDPSPPSGTTVSQSQIESELQRLIQAGTISAPTDNSLYMVYFPPGYTVLAGGWFSCTTSDGFCGFHHWFAINGRSAYYGVLVDSSACGSRCGPGTQLGNTTSTSSHELLEAVTDPVDSGWYYLYSVNGQPAHAEIADICQDQQTQTAGFTVQRAWSNLQQACVVKNPCLSCPGGFSCHCGDFVCRSNTSMCP